MRLPTYRRTLSLTCLSTYLPFSFCLLTLQFVFTLLPAFISSFPLSIYLSPYPFPSTSLNVCHFTFLHHLATLPINLHIFTCPITFRAPYLPVYYLPAPAPFYPPVLPFFLNACLCISLNKLSSSSAFLSSLTCH